ncbi:MAG: hypothetical protein ACHP7N_01250 [Caulobacterales bacterium]
MLREVPKRNAYRRLARWRGLALVVGALGFVAAILVAILYI